MPVQIRAGYRFVNTENNVTSNNVVQNITESQAYIGFGIPMVRRYFDNTQIRSLVNVDFGFMQRGTLNNNLAKEQYFTARVGFNLGDIWFQRKKIQLSLIAFILLLVSCSDSTLSEYRSRKSSDSITTAEKALDVAIEYTEAGKLRAILYSKELSGEKQAKDPYMEMPKGVEVEFIDDNGELESYLTSEYAISYNKSKRIVLKRNVDVMNLKGERFLTEELVWEPKN